MKAYNNLLGQLKLAICSLCRP